MKHLKFFSAVLVCFGICLSVMANSKAQSPSAILQEGKSYTVLNTELLNEPAIQQFRAKYPNEKVQIIEFFSYGCHWCRSIDPKVYKWLKNKKNNKVAFHQLPIVFNPAWRMYGKAFYTAKHLNVLDKLHNALFQEIHDYKNNLNSEAKLAKFFQAKGVDAQLFHEVFGSFDTSRQLKASQMMAKTFRIRAVPTFIVITSNGIYETATGMAGSEDAVFAVLEHLIEIANS